MTVVELVDVDEIWRLLGRWGKFQTRHLLMLLAMIFPWAFHQLSVVFIGFRPDFECKKVRDDRDNLTKRNTSSAWREYESCSIKHYSNESGDLVVTETDCTEGFVYSIPEKQSFVTEWDLVCEGSELAELTQAMMGVGMMIGAVLFTAVADRVGRKPIMIFCHVALLGIATGTAFSTNYTLFVVLRILNGALTQGMGFASATLATESFPKEVRAFTGVLGLLTWTTSMCLVSPVAYALRNDSWRYIQLTFALVSFWSLFQWWLCDESLRWLIANKRLRAAKAVLKKACKVNGKDYETIATTSGFRDYEQQLLAAETDLTLPNNGHTDGIDKVENANDVPWKRGTEKVELQSMINSKNKEEENVKIRVLDVLKDKRLLKTSLICWFTWLTVDLSYYGLYFISGSLAGNRFLNFFLTAVVEYPASLLQYLIINRIGRKKTVVTFFVIAAVDLIIATVLMTVADGRTAYLATSTAFVMIGKMGVTGAYSSIFIYTSELYPTNMRNLGMGMASASSRIGGLVSIFFRNLAAIVVWAPCAIFAGMCLIVIVLMFFLPETKEHELPQTMTQLKTMHKAASEKDRTGVI